MSAQLLSEQPELKGNRNNHSAVVIPETVKIMQPGMEAKWTNAQNNHMYSLGVMITSKNRVDDLRRTLEAVKGLNPQPDEILITADGCSDNTVACVKALLPNARLFINETGRGSVVSRDHMLRAAESDLVLSLDDDSYPEQRDCVANLKELFSSKPQLAVAHFPQHTDEYPDTLHKVDFGSPRLTGSYANSGACYRRSTYVILPGFEESFFHMYEEPDYALQCTAAGYNVLFWPGITIRHHYSSTGRNEIGIHHRHARNELWSVLMRCPMPLVIFAIPYRIFSQARYALSRGFDWVIREPLWWYTALQGIGGILSKRIPVTNRRYWKWLKLLRSPIEYRIP